MTFFPQLQFTGNVLYCTRLKSESCSVRNWIFFFCSSINVLNDAPMLTFCNGALGLLAAFKRSRLFNNLPSWGYKYWCCERVKNEYESYRSEIYELLNDLRMIFCVRVRGHVNRVGFYTIPYNRARAVGVGLPNTGKHNISCRKESYSVWDHLLRKSRWTAVGWPLDGSIFTPHP